MIFYPEGCRRIQIGASDLRVLTEPFVHLFVQTIGIAEAGLAPMPQQRNRKGKRSSSSERSPTEAAALVKVSLLVFETLILRLNGDGGPVGLER